MEKLTCIGGNFYCAGVREYDNYAYALKKRRRKHWEVDRLDDQKKEIPENIQQYRTYPKTPYRKYC